MSWKDTLQAPSRDLPHQRGGQGWGGHSQWGQGWLNRTSWRPCWAGHGSSKTLVSHSPSLWKGDRHWQFQYSYLFKHFHLMLYHIILQIFISSWSFSVFSQIFLFPSSQALRKLRKAAEFKCYASCLDWEGLQELELAILGTPASKIVELLSVRVHRACESAPPSAGAPSTSVEGWQAPSHLGQAPKKACYTSTTTTLVAPKEEVTMLGMHLPTSPSKAIVSPLRTSMFLMALQGDLPSPATYLTSHFLPDPSSEPTERALAKCSSAISGKSIPASRTQWCPTVFRNIWGSV